MDEVKTTVDLHGIAEKGYTRFSIKAEDTPQNAATHGAFKEFCEVECDNNYTLGLRKLLENYETDARFEGMWDHIATLRDEVVELQKRVEALEKPVKKEDKGGVF
jgi:hypothetical protein